VAQGINATGMEQVAEEAPVSKRTLYAHFRTKNELVIAHLQGLARSGATLEGVLAREDVPARERLRRLFGQPARDAAPVRGCPFIDAAAEFPAPESAVHSYAREQKLRMVDLIAALLTELGCREPLALAEQLATSRTGRPAAPWCWTTRTTAGTRGRRRTSSSTTPCRGTAGSDLEGARGMGAPRPNSCKHA
jgi:AcrR family transcriptional regulator